MSVKKYQESKDFFIKGLEQMKNKNYIKARDFFNSSLELIPDRLSILNNLAIVLIELKNFTEAEKLVNEIKNLFPHNEEFFLLQGKIFTDKKKYDEAIKLYDKVIAINPNSFEAHNALSYIFKQKNLFQESINHIQKSLSIKKDQNFIYGDYLSLKLRQSDWNNFEITNIKEKINENQNAISPFSLINLVDDPDLHFNVAKAYNNFIYPINQKIARDKKKNKSKKIKVAYYSSDFRDHPVFRLIIGMLELHDKEKFDVYLFSFLPTADENINKRILDTEHKLINASLMSDDEIVKLSKFLDIDIAIDLNGLTLNSRPEIFEMVCAPIQINYLGYPGTSGSKNIDYIIADKFVIDKKNEKNFTEKIIYLPDSYQVNDYSRFGSFINLKKKDFGLPENDFIFCCFNNNVKINPDIFNHWMQILRNVNNSVLWLLGNENEDFSNNLKKESFKKDIDPKRLIFAPRAKYDYYLSRYIYADLFLDTFPYNAHTTASDCLWVGVPLLTLSGKSFSSRVAGSLLNAIGLPELITYSVDDYINKAIEISTNKKKLDELKNKLKLNKSKYALFDTVKFTRTIEKAYIQVYERYYLGLNSKNIEIN